MFQRSLWKASLRIIMEENNMDDDRVCIECGQPLEEVVHTARNGRPVWHWRCVFCGCEYDDDGNMLSCDDAMTDEDFATANFYHGGDLRDD